MRKNSENVTPITDLQVTEVEVDDDVVEEALVLEADVVLGVDGHLVQPGRRELAVLGVDLKAPQSP